MRRHGRKHGRMYLRTIDSSADSEEARDELASSRLCATVNRAYERRLSERGLIATTNDNTDEPSAHELDEIESEDES